MTYGFTQWICSRESELKNTKKVVQVKYGQEPSGSEGKLWWGGRSYEVGFV